MQLVLQIRQLQQMIPCALVRYLLEVLLDFCNLSSDFPIFRLRASLRLAAHMHGPISNT